MIPSHLPPGCTDRDIDDNEEAEPERCDNCGEDIYRGTCAACDERDRRRKADKEDNL